MQYAIYEENMERLLKKMTTIQNKCRKYGCDFSFSEVGEEFRKIKDEKGKELTVRYVLVEASGTAIKNDWRFVASLEHTPKGNLIKGITGVEVPEQYYTCEPKCEHCSTNRIRKDTYIVQNTVTGEFKQVGKKCLNDFTNGMSAEGVARYISLYDALIEGEAPSEGGYGREYYNTATFLCYAAETIRHFGYQKSDEYGECRRTTKQRTADYFYLKERGWAISYACKREYEEEMNDVGFDAYSEQNKALVKSAAEWIENCSEDNGYIHNLKTACSLKYVSHKEFGLLVSLFPAYQREIEHRERYSKQEKAQKAEAEASQCCGKVGERLSFEVKECKCVTSWETQFGLMKLYKFTDDSDNVYTWKTSNYVETDKVASIKGTVKSHTEYNGVKQTELTRCKVIEK